MGASHRSRYAKKYQPACRRIFQGILSRGMSSQERIYREGVVEEALPSTLFRVRLDVDGGGEILARLAGRMRLHHIRVLPGDRVRIEISPYDPTKGRIVHRLK